MISRVLMAFLLVLMTAMVVWALTRPGDDENVNTRPQGPSTKTPLRLALIPERDVFAQRRRYQELASYLAKRLDQPVELVTLNTYSAILDELRNKTIDGGFAGSMVAVLARDRLGARVLVKPEHAEGVSTYRGVIIVAENSPIQSIEDLRGHSLAMVRTTTAGNLYPLSLLARANLLDQGKPEFRWVGTHDEVAQAVADGHVDAGAIKDLRLDAFEKDHPDVRLRRLAISEAVPDNGLMVRGDLDESLRERLREILLTMDTDPQGQEVLKLLGDRRFLPCPCEEYQPVYDMVNQIGSAWPLVGIDGPPPGKTNPAEH